VYVVAERRLTFSELAVQLLFWSPLAAALTAVTGVLIMIIFRGTLEPKSA
jgi:hypothetical protein